MQEAALDAFWLVIVPGFVHTPKLMSHNVPATHAEAISVFGLGLIIPNPISDTQGWPSAKDGTQLPAAVELA